MIDDTNYYVTGASWDSTTGVISLARNGSLATLTVDIDGRYAYASDIAGATDRVAFFSDADSVTGSADFTWDDTDLTLVSSTSEKPRITLENTNADGNPAFLRFFKNTASPAGSDRIGAINFTSKEATSGDTKTYFQILGRINDPTNASPNGQLDFYNLDGDTPGFVKGFSMINNSFYGYDSSENTAWRLTHTGTRGALFRSEGNKMRLQASSNSQGEIHMMANYVGINTTSPGENLHVNGTSRVTGKAAFGGSTLPTNTGINVVDTVQISEKGTAPSAVTGYGIYWV